MLNELLKPAPAKRYYLIKGIACLIVALVFALLGFANGVLFMELVALLPLGWAAFYFARSRNAKAQDRVSLTPITPDTPAPEKLKYFRRSIWIILLGFPLLTWDIVHDLNRVEYGKAQNVEVWAPVAAIYNRFGYTAAVLLVPTIGILVLLNLVAAIRRTTKEIKQKESQPRPEPYR